MNVSGKTISPAPFAAASAIRRTDFSTVASRSRQTGVAGPAAAITFSMALLSWPAPRIVPASAAGRAQHLRPQLTIEPGPQFGGQVEEGVDVLGLGPEVHDARPQHEPAAQHGVRAERPAVELDVGHQPLVDRKSTRLNSSHITISYAVFCLKKKKKKKKTKKTKQ